MKIIDAYLSRKAQQVCPSALVFRMEGEEGREIHWNLERKEGETLCLGFKFGEAHASVLAFIKAEKARKEGDPK